MAESKKRGLLKVKLFPIRSAGKRHRLNMPINPDRFRKQSSVQLGNLNVSFLKCKINLLRIVSSTCSSGAKRQAGLLVSGAASQSEVLQGAACEFRHNEATLREVQLLQSKPCLFWAQGNCKRADCKFLHSATIAKVLLLACDTLLNAHNQSARAATPRRGTTPGHNQAVLFL
jgi:hypothetical protein